jgi:chemotaxis protein methyltransferase CheR
MTDPECVEFLQWALPRLRLRWPGFRKVRRRVCKRLERRFRELGVPDHAAYRAYLERHADEWSVIDTLCTITISRFYRDRGVFQTIERDVLPALAQMAVGRGEPTLRCWSIGCASGEEPYTLSLLWRLGLKERVPCDIQIIATDIDDEALVRARDGCYPPSSVKELPAHWPAEAFSRRTGSTPAGRTGDPVIFLHQDIRTTAPDGPFHLILCRNLAFTYFDDALQRGVLATIQLVCYQRSLVIGATESLPEPAVGFASEGAQASGDAPPGDTASERRSPERRSAEQDWVAPRNAFEPRRAYNSHVSDLLVPTHGLIDELTRLFGSSQVLGDHPPSPRTPSTRASTGFRRARWCCSIPTPMSHGCWPSPMAGGFL